MASLDRCLNVYDLRAAAKRRLPRAVFEFVDRGSEDGVAVVQPVDQPFPGALEHIGRVSNGFGLRGAR